MIDFRPDPIMTFLRCSHLHIRPFLMSRAALISLFALNIVFVVHRIMNTYIIEPNAAVYSYPPNQRFLITPFTLLTLGAWMLSSLEITLLLRGLRQLESMVFSLQFYEIQHLLQINGLNSNRYLKTL